MFSIYDCNGEVQERLDGAVNKEENVLGTYIHGVFDGVEFREKLINKLRAKKGIELKKSNDYENIREKNLDMLADIVRRSLDMDKIYEIMGLKK